MLNIRLLDLSLFGEGEAAQSAGAQPEVVPDSSESLGPKNETAPENGAGSLDEPAIETSTGSEGEEAETPNAESRKSAFQKMIREEYREEYHNEVQKIINKRFKAMRQLEERANRLDGVSDTLCRMYGAKTIEEAVQKIEENYIADQAYQHNMSVDQYRMIAEAERIQAERDREVRQREADIQIEKTVQGWYEEAAKLREVYPDFDLKTEIDQNDMFLSLLKSGVPVRSAYEVANLEAIKEQAKKEAASKMSASIQSKQTRPPEAALGASQSSGVKVDVSKLTAAERRDLAERALRGETITL